jgi:hypothetical protein
LVTIQLSLAPATIAKSAPLTPRLRSLRACLCYNSGNTMAAHSNDLTWSFSRMKMFHACRRRYYYHYLKWGGWGYVPDTVKARLI